MKVRSLVLLSGGLDSAANLALAVEQDLPVLAMTIRYGQRAEEAEVLAAEKLCRYYGVPHQVIDARWLGEISQSSLNKMDQAVPQLKTSELDQLDVIEKTAKAVWVPNRNGVFIHIAAAYAESLKIDRVLLGFNSEEAVTFPDNSVEYLRAVNQALYFSTANHVQVYSYTVAWNKKQIIQELGKLKTRFPLEDVWSCYLGGPQACGMCESCKRLTRAIAT